EFFFDRLAVTNKKVADLNREDRNKLISMLKKFDFSVKCLDNINVSIVTSGGVCVDEVNPKTCESKLVKNLYFVGEVLDVDALTGGFNLQIAWATGHAAGNSIKGK
ncbi:MAG: NAD(P)/FAD-dependent oxidoreductase, partial [Clostridia bacterium]|nr:NAD(P)/FAD-dependent oxidoreductase [Clostridia bacterium]